MFSRQPELLKRLLAPMIGVEFDAEAGITWKREGEYFHVHGKQVRSSGVQPHEKFSAVSSGRQVSVDFDLGENSAVRGLEKAWFLTFPRKIDPLSKGQ